MKFQIVRVDPRCKVEIVGRLANNSGADLLEWARNDNDTPATLLKNRDLPVVVCKDGTRYYLR
jgi:intracellular sulfur oxidation DsrE/DsrF family protein